MTDTITTFAEKLQELLYDFSKNSSKLAKFIIRHRLLDIKKWLLTSLKWIKQKNPTLGSLANLFAKKGVIISKQALGKKFNMNCAEYLRMMLAQTLSTMVNKSNAKAPLLLSLFNGVYIADCTILQLSEQTKDLFPGVGGKDEKVNVSELKIFLRIEATTGVIEHFAYDSSRTSDSKFHRQTDPLPQRALELADIAYINQERLWYNLKNNIYFICRFQSHSVIYYNNQKYTISEFLQQQEGNEIDILIHFGRQKVPVRFIARRVSEEVAKQKLASVTHTANKLGRQVSQAQTIVSKWQFYITNIGSDMCTLDEVVTLYSVRWQIELIFKLWKNNMALNDSNGKTTVRVLCEKLLKMIYLLIFHNHEILAGIGPVCEISHVEILDRYNNEFDRLLDVLWKKRTSRTISKVIKQTVTFMLENPKRNTRITDPLLYDRLNKRQLSQTIIVSS